MYFAFFVGETSEGTEEEKKKGKKEKKKKSTKARPLCVLRRAMERAHTASKWISQIIYQSINQSIYLSIYLSIYPSIHLSIHPSVHPSIDSICACWKTNADTDPANERKNEKKAITVLPASASLPIPPCSHRDRNHNRGLNE